MDNIQIYSVIDQCIIIHMAAQDIVQEDSVPEMPFSRDFAALLFGKKLQKPTRD